MWVWPWSWLLPPAPTIIFLPRALNHHWGAWCPLLGEPKEMSLCCTGRGHLLPKDLCSVTSSVGSACLIFLSMWLCLSHSLCVCHLSLSLFSSPRISGDVAQACDSVQIGAESHSIRICLPSPFLSHRPVPPSPSLSPGCGSVPLRPCFCPSHLSGSLLWPHSSRFLYSVSLTPAPQPISAWGRY